MVPGTTASLLHGWAAEEKTARAVQIPCVTQSVCDLISQKMRQDAVFSGRWLEKGLYSSIRFTEKAERFTNTNEIQPKN